METFLTYLEASPVWEFTSPKTQKPDTSQGEAVSVGGFAGGLRDVSCPCRATPFLLITTLSWWTPPITLICVARFGHVDRRLDGLAGAHNQFLRLAGALFLGGAYIRNEHHQKD